MSIELRVQWVQPTDTPIIGILKISSLHFFSTFCRNSNCLRAEKRRKGINAVRMHMLNKEV